MNDENLNESIHMAHLKDQLEAAAEQAGDVSNSVNNYMMREMGREAAAGITSYEKLIQGYLMEKWTWFHPLLPGSGLEPFAPHHCDHVDPNHPGIWYGLMNIPNWFWCQECAGEVIKTNEDRDAHVCDRCSDPNTHQFYDFSVPLGNILMIGSICKSCVDKSLVGQ